MKELHKICNAHLDTVFESPLFYGQTAFGTDQLRADGNEAVYQKWCAAVDEEKALAVLNRGTYGGSLNGGTLGISLMRTPVYSAHPIGSRQLADTDRSHDHIDLGEREFEYRITADTAHLDMQAELYNQPCIALLFFPPEQERQLTR